MPMLDVAFVLSDPMLADDFNVVRRTDAIGADGRTAPGAQRIERLWGIVTQGDPADLMRAENGQFVPRTIMVVTAFRLQGAVRGYQPDIIEWGGTQYLVKRVYPYSAFGEGFWEAVAESMSATDGPQ